MCVRASVREHTRVRLTARRGTDRAFHEGGDRLASHLQEPMPRLHRRELNLVEEKRAKIFLDPPI